MQSAKPARITLLFTLLFVAITALAMPPRATAQATAAVLTPPRPIHGATVIDRPGVYALARHFKSNGTGAAIAIRSGNVTLDLGGYTVTGPGGKQGMGISVEGVTNVRIAGGALRAFGVGVVVTGSTNVSIEDVQIDGNDLGGTPPDVEVGIMIVQSRGVVVADNTITDTFLGIFVRGENSGGNRIVHNTLEGGANGQLGICYNPAEAETGARGPDGDLVYANHIADFNLGIALNPGSTANIVRGNSLATRVAAIEEGTPGVNLVEDNAAVDLP
jgi:nitrous oxidase accessory protein NosD